MQSILRNLSSAPAPAGSEICVRKKIESYFTSFETYTDPHGSLVVHKKGTGDGIVLLTAMDTPCIYVTYSENGFARFSAVGGLVPSVGMGVLCEGGVFGVIGKDEKGFFIDTGKNVLAIGQWAVPTPRTEAVDDDKIMGASIGQYACMTAMISAALKETTKDAYFVFATKSHIRQLSPTFMQKINAKALYAVDVSAANDTPSEKTVFAALGNGTSLRVKDAGILSSPSLLAHLADAPQKTYKEVSTLTGVGGTVQKAYGGIESASIGIPVRYKGSENEMVSLHDVVNTADLLAFILK